MAKDIKDILDNKEESPPDKPEVVETPEVEKTEVVEAIPEGDTPEEKPEAIESKPDELREKVIGGLKAATTAERNKRQQVERERDELRQELDRREALFREQMAQLVNQVAPKPPETPKPTIWEDPEAVLNGQKSELENTLRQRDLQWSERIARVKYGDDAYTAAEMAAQEAVRLNPNDSVVHLVRNSADPADALVQWHKQQTQLSDIQNPEAMLEKMLKEASPELKAKILMSIGGQPVETKAQTPAPTALPTNLAGARSVRGNTKTFTGAPPIGDILASRKK